MKEPLGQYSSLEMDAFSTLYVAHFKECFSSSIRLSASRNHENHAIPLILHVHTNVLVDLAQVSTLQKRSRKN